jgi:hypothetical protein
MKRYRTWEVNRKFFIYPENWLEPEFRDVKSHLFQDLESTLLQGDVSRELVEGAYHQYLSRLDEIARLEIMTVYCEEKTADLKDDVLHVIGRTFNPPQQYFYRRYAHGMWTPWEPMELQIEGDHLTAIMWQGRLHVFWVTFMEKAEQDSKTEYNFPTDEGESGTTVLMKKEVQVQLNWSEYFKGRWTARKSGGFADVPPLKVPNAFDKKDVFIHATKGVGDEDPKDKGIKVHLYFDPEGEAVPPKADVAIPRYSAEPIGLQLVSKNSLPEETGGEFPPKPPYEDIRKRATRYHGVSSLNQKTDLKKILGKETEHLLTFAAQPEAAKSGAGMTFTPFFYQDNRSEHTFFVEKMLVAQSLKEYEGIGFFTSPLVTGYVSKVDEWKEIIPCSPVFKGGKLADLLDPVAPLSKYLIRIPRDWCTDPAILLEFDGRLVGAGGGMEREDLMGDAAAGDVAAMAKAAELRGFMVIGGNGLSAEVLGKFRRR